MGNGVISTDRLTRRFGALTAVDHLDLKAQAGADLVLDIDVQGARQLQERIPDAVSIFILAPSREILESRLRARSEDSEQVIQRRLREAAEEIRNFDRYDYILVNREVDDSVKRLQAIVAAERIRTRRVKEEIRPILATFQNALVPARGE